MRILIGGGSGFIGQALKLSWCTRHRVEIISRLPEDWNLSWDAIAKNGLPPCDVVINVAGQNIMNPLRMWTKSFKQEVAASRINTTRILSEAIAKSENPPRSFVVITGVGYYPPSQTTLYTEDSPGGNAGFITRLVQDWENAAQLPLTNSKHVTQLTRVRSGVVLGPNGGVIPHLMWPFLLYLGGTLGSGSQPFPWIHITDLCRLVWHIIEKEEGVGGVLNAVSPSSVSDTNADFTHLVNKMIKRPTWFSVPAFAVQLLLGNERAAMLLEGQRVVPERTLQSGFTFLYPDLDSAVTELFS